MASTLLPIPSISQCRGPLSLTTEAPISSAKTTAFSPSYRLCGQSLRNWVSNTSASNRRAIARNLLHLGRRITFERKRITVTWDRPNSPKVARALGLLLDELAAGTPGHLAGDRRSITYLLTP